MNPREIAEQQFKQIHNQFSQQEDILMNTEMSDEDFNNSMQQLQSKYTEVKSKFDASMAELDTVERLTQQGAITPEAANEAMFRMVVPPETAAAMFPRQATQRQPSRPLTPDQLENFDESIGQHVQSAPSKERGGVSALLLGQHENFFGKSKSQSSLTAAYMKWRDRIQYDMYEPHHQKQLDTEWDAVMNSDDRFEWDANKPEVRILRTKGPISSAIINKKFQTPTRMTGNGPMQVGIAKQLPQQKTEQRVRVRGKDGKVGTIPASQLNEALKSGYKKL